MCFSDSSASDWYQTLPDISLLSVIFPLNKFPYLLYLHTFMIWSYKTSGYMWIVSLRGLRPNSPRANIGLFAFTCCFPITVYQIVPLKLILDSVGINVYSYRTSNKLHFCLQPLMWLYLFKGARPSTTYPDALKLYKDSNISILWFLWGLPNAKHCIKSWLTQCICSTSNYLPHLSSFFAAARKEQGGPCAKHARSAALDNTVSS